MALVIDDCIKADYSQLALVAVVSARDVTAYRLSKLHYANVMQESRYARESTPELQNGPDGMGRNATLSVPLWRRHVFYSRLMTGVCTTIKMPLEAQETSNLKLSVQKPIPVQCHTTDCRAPLQTLSFLNILHLHCHSMTKASPTVVYDQRSQQSVNPTPRKWY